MVAWTTLFYVIQALRAQDVTVRGSVCVSEVCRGPSAIAALTDLQSQPPAVSHCSE